LRSALLAIQDRQPKEADIGPVFEGYCGFFSAPDLLARRVHSLLSFMKPSLSKRPKGVRLTGKVERR